MYAKRRAHIKDALGVPHSLRRPRISEPPPPFVTRTSPRRHRPVSVIQKRTAPRDAVNLQPVPAAHRAARCSTAVTVLAVAPAVDHTALATALGRGLVTARLRRRALRRPVARTTVAVRVPPRPAANAAATTCVVRLPTICPPAGRRGAPSHRRSARPALRRRAAGGKRIRSPPFPFAFVRAPAGVGRRAGDKTRAQKTYGVTRGGQSKQQALLLEGACELTSS